MFAGCAGRIEYHRMGSMCASCTEILVFHREHPCVEIGPSFYLTKGTNRPKETFAGCAGQIEYHGDGINVCLVYGNFGVPQRTPVCRNRTQFLFDEGYKQTERDVRWLCGTNRISSGWDQCVPRVYGECHVHCTCIKYKLGQLLLNNSLLQEWSLVVPAGQHFQAVSFTNPFPVAIQMPFSVSPFYLIYCLS